MIDDVETNSEKYEENPTWDDIHNHRKRQFTTERGFKFYDHFFQRQKDPAWEKRLERYFHFDKDLFDSIKGTYLDILTERGGGLTIYDQRTSTSRRDCNFYNLTLMYRVTRCSKREAKLHPVIKYKGQFSSVLK